MSSLLVLINFYMLPSVLEKMSLGGLNSGVMNFLHYLLLQRHQYGAQCAFVHGILCIYKWNYVMHTIELSVGSLFQSLKDVFN